MTDTQGGTAAPSKITPHTHTMHYLDENLLPVNTGRILTELEETPLDKQIEVLSREGFSLIAALAYPQNYCAKIKKIRELNAIYASVLNEEGRETRRYQPLSWCFDLSTSLLLHNPISPNGSSFARSPETQHDVKLPDLGAAMYLIARYDETPPGPPPPPPVTANSANGHRPPGGPFLGRKDPPPPTASFDKGPSLPRMSLVFSPTKSGSSLEHNDLWSIRLRPGLRDVNGNLLPSEKKADLRPSMTSFENLLLSSEIDLNAQKVFVDIKDVDPPKPTAKNKRQAPSKSSSRNPLTVVVRIDLGPAQYATATAARNLCTMMKASGVDPQISSRHDTGVVHLAWAILDQTAPERHTSSAMAAWSLVNHRGAKVIHINGSPEIVACVQTCDTKEQLTWYQPQALAYLNDVIRAGPPSNVYQSDASTNKLRDAGVEIAIRHLSQFVVPQIHQKSPIDEEIAAEWDAADPDFGL